MNKELEQKLESEFRQRFQEIHSSGVKQGVTAICSVILEKARDESKTYEERISGIVQFCSIGISNNNEV